MGNTEHNYSDWYIDESDACDNSTTYSEYVKRCTEELNAIYKKAEQGDAEAQYRLGSCYYNGDGVNEDKAEAVKWYRKAAEQGDSNARKL